MKVVARFVVAAALVTATASAQTVVRPASGAVILARAGTTPLYLWDATSYVEQLGRDAMLGDAGMRAIETTALSILNDKAASSNAPTLSLKIVYEKIGAVSPVYRAATMEGVENLLTISAPRSALLAHVQDWEDAVASGKAVPQLVVQSTGQLPPN